VATPEGKAVSKHSKHSNSLKAISEREPLRSKVVTAVETSPPGTGDQKPSTALAHEQYGSGSETNKVLDHPTIKHPSKMFMNNVLAGMQMGTGIILRDKSESVIKKGSSRPIYSRQQSLQEYYSNKEKAGPMGFSMAELAKVATSNTNRTSDGKKIRVEDAS
jgi:hypothetical protein